MMGTPHRDRCRGPNPSLSMSLLRLLREPAPGTKVLVDRVRDGVGNRIRTGGGVRVGIRGEDGRATLAALALQCVRLQSIAITSSDRDRLDCACSSET